MKFDLTFEKMILAKLLKHHDFAHDALRVLSPENFSVRSLSYLYSIIADYIGTYGKLPTKNELKLEIKKSKLNDIKKKQRYLLLKQLLRMTTFDDKDYALSRLKEFVEENNYIKALKNAADIYADENDIKKSKEIISREIIKSYEIQNYKISSYIDKWEERQQLRKYYKEHPDENKVIPTGFSIIDEKIGGGKKGQLFAIIATTGKGKTMFLINIIFHAIYKNYKILAIFPENTMTEIEQKLDSRFTSIVYRSLSECDYTKEEITRANRIMDIFKEGRKNNVRLATVIPETCNISSIHSVWNEITLDKSFIPDMLVIDGADLLKPLRRYSEYRFEQQAVYWDIKNFLLQKNIFGWVSAQAKQEYASATKKANAEAFREAYAKATICDGIFSLNATEQQLKDRQAVLWVAKGRDFEDKFGVVLETRRHLMTMKEICLYDSGVVV